MNVTTNLGAVAVATTGDGIHIVSEAETIAVQVILTGEPDACIMGIDGSLDGTNWGQIDTHTFSAGELTALSALFYVTSKPVPYIRVNSTTLTIIERVLASIVYTGTGDGTLATASIDDSSPVETWTLTCTTGGATGKFSVVGSTSGAQADATVGTPFDSIVAFTLTDGAVDFVIGDEFVFNSVIDGSATTLIRYDDSE